MKAVWALLSLTQQVLRKINLTQQFQMKILTDACLGHQLKEMQRYYERKFPLGGQTCNLGQICICHNENRRHTKVLPVRNGTLPLSDCTNSITTHKTNLTWREKKPTNIWRSSYFLQLPQTNNLFTHLFTSPKGKKSIQNDTMQTSQKF